MPSSIHEVIILPVSMAPSWEELDLIVREMNQTQLDREDVLSDRVYFLLPGEGETHAAGKKNKKNKEFLAN